MIDETLVRSLLSEQHPDLAGLDLCHVDGGWDNQMWRLGDDLAVRLPRTERAPSLLKMEYRWVPELAPHLPLPVPVPVRVGKPSDRFPSTWIVTTWVAGEPADHSPIERGPHAAGALASFLSDLHREAPGDAPVNRDRGGPLKEFAGEIDRNLQSMDSDRDVTGLRTIWNDATAAPEWDRPPVWLHGDLHPANVVVADGSLAGVIDFGELCAGDPATDLAAAWLLLPDGATTEFFDEYATADKDAIRRARGWALRRALHLIEIGHAGEMGWAGGKPTWKPAGEATLHRLLTSTEPLRAADLRGPS